MNAFELIVAEAEITLAVVDAAMRLGPERCEEIHALLALYGHLQRFGSEDLAGEIREKVLSLPEDAVLESLACFDAAKWLLRAKRSYETSETQEVWRDLDDAQLAIWSYQEITGDMPDPEALDDCRAFVWESAESFLPAVSLAASFAVYFDPEMAHRSIELWATTAKHDLLMGLDQNPDLQQGKIKTGQILKFPSF